MATVGVKGLIFLTSLVISDWRQVAPRMRMD